MDSQVVDDDTEVSQVDGTKGDQPYVWYMCPKCRIAVDANGWGFELHIEKALAVHMRRCIWSR